MWSPFSKGRWEPRELSARQRELRGGVCGKLPSSQLKSSSCRAEKTPGTDSLQPPWHVGVPAQVAI